MRKVLDINKMKKVNKGRRKKSIEIRIFLDDESVFIEGNRVDTPEENAVKRVFKDVIEEYQIENGFIEDTESNRNHIKYLRINKQV